MQLESSIDRASDHRRRRRLMVWEQLLRRGIHDHRVLGAMGAVRREEFVPPQHREAAYRDGPLPIGHGQTISQPYTVAFMCQALELDGTETVLEIGTGSGYGAAVLSRLARFVYTVECIPELACSARDRLVRLGYKNVAVRETDGSLGLDDEAPFDAIVVTAAAERAPAILTSQLEEGGRLIIPVGRLTSGQTLRLLTRQLSDVRVHDLGRFNFVPLAGQNGCPSSTLRTTRR